MLDILEFLNESNIKSRYQKQLNRLSKEGKSIERFEKVVSKAIENINNNIRSFCIYGDPQSGKTEMMIILTAKLLDEGKKMIIVLLNDNVELLKQNLKRFSKSGLDPTPKNYREIIDPNINISDQEWVIFCKKNSKDLQKLIEKVGDFKEKVIIDDEGDYATPNAKINRNEQTRINQLVEQLLGNGIYIGVTATPARLDLNNTFNNASTHWIYFEPHDKYTGQDVFFPININDNLKYHLKRLPEEYDDPKYLREALLRFFVNAAYLNKQTNKNYCMLVHTSGKRVDHSEDYKQIIETFNILSNKNNKNFNNYVEQLFNISKEKLGSNEKEAKELTKYILDNIRRNKIVVMNSDIDTKNFDYTDATNPISLFTIAIGGNIVSRGVTFDNLLSMFFTRDVKHKIQQDTYIQRARMFGNRGDYLEHFELTIPEQLYLDWHKCFIFHRLSLESAKIGNPPVWIEDKRIRAVSSASIDKTTVSMNSGEMSFEIFQYNSDIDRIIEDNKDSFSKLKELHNLIGENSLPSYLINFIENFSPDGDASLAFHKSASIEGYKDTNQKNISRQKGLIGKRDLELDKYLHAIHHIKIFFNSDNKSRIFYRYINNVKFLKNIKNSK
jgi:hypothetical protein